MNEVIRWRRVLGILLAFSGVIILIFEPTVLNDLGGVYYALLAAFSMSVSLLFMKKLNDVKVFDLQAWVAFISFIFLGFASYFLEQGQMDIIANASIKGWIAVAFTALVATGIGHAGFYYLITKYELSRITPTTLLAPVLGIVNALIISYFSLIDGFNEIISLKIVIGGLLALLGVAIVMLREKNKRLPNSP